MEKLTRKEKIELLEQHYEAAGFNDIREVELESMSEKELNELCKKTQ